MFSAAIKHAGINGIYVPFMVTPDQIGQAVQSLRVLNIAGANVTLPYKEAVIPFLDVLSEGAQIIGSINTITRKDKVLKGYNTNAVGFMNALEEAGFDAAGKSALVFGTGGAARAVVFMLKWLNANPILVTGRNQEKTRQLVDRIGGEALTFDFVSNQAIPANLVVNASSVSSNDESPELASLVGSLSVTGCELILDLNYGRSQNFWQDMARTQNIRFQDGLSSLAYQARRTFALWTGVTVEPEVFLKALAPAIEP
ncbi:MAG TPA: shikimate dehydrogenase [Desulfobacterales bacterium]|nr:shikimate dehydrogenase [Desulfobacterales bacterium]